MEDIAKAHAKDMETQRKYGVEYSKYWVNESGKKVFCLCHAPNAEAAECVHREAHGMMAEKIIEIQPEVAEGFLGGTETNDSRCGRATRRSRCTRSGNSYGFVHRRCKFNDIDSIARRRGGAGFARCARHDCAGCLVRSRRPRDQAYRRRHYGLLHLSSRAPFDAQFRFNAN